MQQLAGAALPVGLSAWEGSPPYPCQGDCFKAGSQYFTEVVAWLQTAVPPSWRGAAADAYTAELSTLVTQAQTMAALDLEMETLVKDHAEVVVDTQLGIGVEQGVLIVAYPIVRVLEVKPETYPAALSAATATAGGAIYAAMGLLSWCLGTSVQTGQAVDQLAYGDVIAAVQGVIDAFSSAAVSAPRPSGSVASSHAPDFDSLSVSSAISVTPTVAASPGPASGLRPHQVAPMDVGVADAQRGPGDATTGLCGKPLRQLRPAQQPSQPAGPAGRRRRGRPRRRQPRHRGGLGNTRRRAGTDRRRGSRPRTGAGSDASTSGVAAKTAARRKRGASTINR